MTLIKTSILFRNKNQEIGPNDIETLSDLRFIVAAFLTFLVIERFCIFNVAVIFLNFLVICFSSSILLRVYYYCIQVIH